MELLKRLVDEYNNFDGSIKSINKLRDLVCYVSDKVEYKADPNYRIVLFDAAQLLRTFGYNVQNNIKIDDIWNSGDIGDIRHQAIHNYYTSKVYSNNLIDSRQKEILDLFNILDTKRLIVSAPTSFGKTFILRELLFSDPNRYNNILLVFPTVALLNENTKHFTELINVLGLDYRIVNNVYSEVDPETRNIYILTPERTLKLLANYDNLNIDFFFFDEVYKIDEDLNLDDYNAESSQQNDNNQSHLNKNRAEAFRIALYILSSKVKEYYIAGPYLNLDNVKLGFSRYLNVNNITVKQIEFEPTLRITIDAWKKNGTEINPIEGDIKISFPYKSGEIVSTKTKIKAITTYLQENQLGQAIIYCSTPKNSMNYANDIILHLENNSAVIDKHESFIDHLKRRYGIRYSVNGQEIYSSDYWSLIKILSSGFGVHHGKFPKYIQNEILNMFNDGDINYLFCTSTIIEGVNTNAKNVVIVNNSVGSTSLTSFALKNIRGRAGRYYHHFIGRVFYANKKQRDIEKNEDIQLNFSIFDDKPISHVDLDNAIIDDLSTKNRPEKTQREESFHKDLLPDNVFSLNRLFARDKQEEYLVYLKNNINSYVWLINDPGNIPRFLNENMIDQILTSLMDVGIITDFEKTRYWAIANTYCNEHFEGLLRYQLKQELNDLNSDIDNAYLTVFSQIRNIIEYEIPRLLCLFESLFKQSCSLEGYEVEQFDMTSIIRYFELGVRTMIGVHLVETGFPIDAIRDIENQLPRLMELDLNESIAFINENLNSLVQVLDRNEYQLLVSSIVG